MLEFGVPAPHLARAVGALRPDRAAGGRAAAISPGWHEVGGFLGASIREFHARHPLPQLLDLWRDAGIEDIRFRRLSLGGGIVVWGRRGG